jgi:hypothetical protein
MRKKKKNILFCNRVSVRLLNKYLALYVYLQFCLIQKHLFKDLISVSSTALIFRIAICLETENVCKRATHIIKVRLTKNVFDKTYLIQYI